MDSGHESKQWLIHSLSSFWPWVCPLSGGEIDLRPKNISARSFAICKSANIERALLEGGKVAE